MLNGDKRTPNTFPSHPRKCRQEPTLGAFCLLSKFCDIQLKLSRQRKLSTRNALQVIRERELEILENDQQTSPKFETGVEKHEETVSIHLVLTVAFCYSNFAYLPTVLPFLRHTFPFSIYFTYPF